MTELPSIAEHWLPPSPHREEALAYLADGRAHLVERGHRMPPLLVFEDGGAIELPRVRYQMTRRGMALVAADEATPGEGTRFYDVCGCIDEMHGRLGETQTVGERERADVERLLGDALGMIARMARRRQHYLAFAERVAGLCTDLAARLEAEALLGPALAQAGAEEVRALLGQDRVLDDDLRRALFAQAERVRAVAQELEDALAAGKAAALAIESAYEEIRGGRVWTAGDKTT